MSFAEGGTQTSGSGKAAFTSYSSDGVAGYQQFSWSTGTKVDDNYMDKAVGGDTKGNDVYYGPWAPGQQPTTAGPSTPTNKKET